MIEDLEGHRIRLAEVPNGHMLVLGQSGCGKTYFCCHRLEEIVEEGGNALVVDYSNSYSREELVNHKVQIEVDEKNPCETTVIFELKAGDKALAVEQITNALVGIADIQSYKQRELLQSCCEELLEDNKPFSFPDLIQRLRVSLWELEGVKGEGDTRQNLSRLLARFMKLQHLKKFFVGIDTQEKPQGRGVTILQLSDLPEELSHVITALCLNLLWQEIRGSKGKPRYSTILLDEIQNLNLKPGSALYSLLREGRKFGVNLILSTQYICDFDAAARAALEQAGTMLFFHPRVDDCKWIGRQLAQKQDRDWTMPLLSLKKGQALLYGNYYLNDNKCMSIRPLIVRST